MEAEMVKIITACLTAVLMTLFASFYVRPIWKGQTSPALATWITFLLGTGFSLVTYLLAQDRDLLAGVLNTMDVLVVSSIVATTLIRGQRHLKFKLFEKLYSAGIALIFLYAVITRDAWMSNIMIQILITLGYIPTILKLVSSRKNTEPFSAWATNFAAGLVALYPAIANGKMLAVTYALRTLACTVMVMLFMAYCRRLEKTKEKK